jgi:magnesium transporter
VLVGLLEAIIDREADRVERTQAEVDKLAQSIFGLKGGERTRARRFDASIRAIGREGELTSRSRESLLTLGRLLTYLGQVLSERGDDKTLRARVKTAQRDVQSLADHIGYLSTKITFLLDATLGMISNEQNGIIKIFSVLAVALMPPTLVGTIYGMNFQNMPELHWAFGYPMALVLMVVSAVIPWLYFKRKGWL